MRTVFASRGRGSGLGGVGRPRPRWIVSAEQTVVRFRMVVAPDSRRVSGASLATKAGSARAYCWKDPKWGSPVE